MTTSREGGTVTTPSEPTRKRDALDVDMMMITDLQLGMKDAATAVGGDTKPTTTQRPEQYLVVNFQPCQVTAPPFAP